MSCLPSDIDLLPIEVEKPTPSDYVTQPSVLLLAYPQRDSNPCYHLERVAS